MGATGLQLSVLGLGSWFFGEQIFEKDVRELIHFAFDQGVNFFDTADKYGNGEAERLIGKAVKKLPRESIVIATKVWAPMLPGPTGGGLSRKHIMEGCGASLKRLGLDHLDIYFCHSIDPNVSIEEVVRAMDDLVRQGKIIYWGTSNWTAEMIREAHRIAQHGGFYGPCVEQSEYSLLVRENMEEDLRPVAEDTSIGLVSYGPLRSGLLSGKYNMGIPAGTRYHLREWLKPVLTDEGDLAKVRELGALAGEMAIPLAQISIAWLLKRSWLTSVITSASKTDQLKENLGALELMEKMTPEILKRMETIVETKSTQLK
jgi:voltage-dependent potassium channel beta subunit